MFSTKGLAQHSVVCSAVDGAEGASLTVAPLCLDVNIAGPIISGTNMFRGPSQMSAVADQHENGTIYFSWTEDLAIERDPTSRAGRIHVTKLQFSRSMESADHSSQTFSGFMRAGGIDITDDGVVGTLCAKHQPHQAERMQRYLAYVARAKQNSNFSSLFPEFSQWSGYQEAYPNGTDKPLDANWPAYDVFEAYAKTNSSIQWFAAEANSPLLLAVCFVDSKTMTRYSTPTRIGVVYRPVNYQWGNINYHSQANYPYHSFSAILSAGYGHLTWAPPSNNTPARWVAWWGANWGTHTGYAMHLMRETEERKTWLEAVMFNVSESAIKDGSFDPPVISRKEVDFFGIGRAGTGDHQSGSMTRYHRGLQDIFHAKHHDNTEMYVQQFGLRGKENMFGKFYTPRGGVHDAGRVYPEGEQTGMEEGAMRSCGNDMLMVYATETSVVCTRFDKNGTLFNFTVMASHGLSRGSTGKRAARLATLGTREGYEGSCGAGARYLMGIYTKDADGRDKRELVEINGECQNTTAPFDVTNLTTWPNYQEWVTTSEGAVAWVTAWPKKEDGTPMFNEWGRKLEDANNSDASFTAFGYTDFPKEAAAESQTEAQLTVYWPAAKDNNAIPSATKGSTGALIDGAPSRTPVFTGVLAIAAAFASRAPQSQ